MLLAIITTFSLTITAAIGVFHLRFKQSMRNQVEALEMQFQEEVNKRSDSENVFSSTISKEQDEIKTLLEEIKILHSEKEEEMQLRLEAQSQIDLALQKTKDIQKRMEDWKIIQDAAVDDAREEISELGDQLADRLSEEFKKDTAKNKEIILNLQRNLSLMMVKFGLTPIHFDEPQSFETAEKPTEKRENKSEEIKKDNAKKELIAEKQLKEEVKNLLEKNGFTYEQDFFLNVNIMEYKSAAKPVIIDCILVEDDEAASAFSFKLAKYVEEYKNSGEEKILEQKLDKLIIYLKNEKLTKAVLQWVKNKTQKETMTTLNLITPVPSSKYTDILEDINYLEKFENENIEVLDISSAG